MVDLIAKAYRFETEREHRDQIFRFSVQPFLAPQTLFCAQQIFQRNLGIKFMKTSFEVPF